MQVNYPEFQCKIIVCGLKILGKDHVQKQIDDMIEGMGYEELKYLIAAYDMVNEEDTTPGIQEFAQLIMKAQENQEGDFPCIFHAGESHFSSNTNLFDALLLGSKRIGHGFNIALHPKLVEYAIQEDVCLEVCPISNLILAYTLDLRCHPARFLINQGLQISLNSDDPGFFNYWGVTLDFTYAFLAWELTIRDLKQLAINGIRFSSLSEELRENHLQRFYKDWDTLIQNFIAKN